MQAARVSRMCPLQSASEKVQLGFGSCSREPGTNVKSAFPDRLGRLKLTYEVRSLLRLGANRNSENAERHKPLDLATTVEITDVLQESGEAHDAL